jgi:hypothetical protein
LVLVLVLLVLLVLLVEVGSMSAGGFMSLGLVGLSLLLLLFLLLSLFPFLVPPLLVELLLPPPELALLLVRVTTLLFVSVAVRVLVRATTVLFVRVFRLVGTGGAVVLGGVVATATTALSSWGVRGSSSTPLGERLKSGLAPSGHGKRSRGAFSIMLATDL